MFEELVEAWLINNRINLFLIENISEEGLKSTTSTRGGRDVARQFAHLHNNRVDWLDNHGPRGAAAGLQKFDGNYSPGKKELKDALEASGEAIGQCLAQASKPDGKLRGWKRGVLPAYGYLVAHDSHHRGSILLTCLPHRRAGWSKFRSCTQEPSLTLELKERSLFSMINSRLAELSSVHKRYGKTIALDGLDLSVAQGELLAVLGPNGAGKTTAISLMLGLQKPDKGSATLFGESPRSHVNRRQIGVMMQEVYLAPELRVREHIQLTASYYPAPLSASSTMELTHTSALADRPYGKLSGGQKRQAQFAMAICGRPRLLFLDEPTVGLDVESRERMWAMLRLLVNQGCSIVLTTHYLEEAEALADRVSRPGQRPDDRFRHGQRDSRRCGSQAHQLLHGTSLGTGSGMAGGRKRYL